MIPGLLVVLRPDRCDSSCVCGYTSHSCLCSSLWMGIKASGRSCLLIIILVGFRLRGLCCSLTQILPRSVCLPLTYLLALGSTAWRRLLLLFFRFPRADQFIAAKPVFWWGWAVIIVPIQGCSSQLYRQLTTYTYCVSQVFCVEQGGGENSPHQS